MIGKKINGLLIIGLDEIRNQQLKLERKQGLRKNAPIYYLCKCDCGNVVSLQKSKILKRKINGCKECCKINFEEYIGNTINSWFVIDFLGDNKFKCKCNCGNIKDVNCYNVIDGLSKNCGCVRKDKMSDIKSINSLIGEKYGKLTVLDDTEKNKYGKTICKCLCECGNIVNVLSNSLRTSHTISCGCTKSLMPSKIKQYLEELGYEIKMEKRVNLENMEMAYLCFDLFIEELNLAIEYDGEPHFIPIDWAGRGQEWAEENLKLVQYRDKIKNDYCRNNNIHILRIPYMRKEDYKELVNEMIEIITNND